MIVQSETMAEKDGLFEEMKRRVKTFQGHRI